MTGTQVSALRFILGALRDDVLNGRPRIHPTTWKALVEVESIAFPNDLESMLFLADEHGGAKRTVDWRLLRARLALAIRALLRAERGERGRWWVGELVGPDGKPVRLFTGYSIAKAARVRKSETVVAQVRGATFDDANPAWNRSHGVDAPQEDWPTRAVVRLARPLWTLARAHGGRT